MKRVITIKFKLTPEQAASKWWAEQLEEKLREMLEDYSILFEVSNTFTGNSFRTGV